MVRGKVRLAGYSSDFPESDPGLSPGLHDRCSIVNAFDDGRIIHNCDTNSGASGSALFARFEGDKYRVVGLHAGWIRFSNGRVVNRGVQVSKWSREAREMR
ncbi:MAG: hypothetical protein SWY16_18310 [Cyanobacteriota bacterium]|nr:hypothetical protein [Cyanobacteriota bacterium]